VRLHCDLADPKLGAELQTNGVTTRHRMFSVIDRTQLQAWPTYDPKNPSVPLVYSTAPVNVTDFSAGTWQPISLSAGTMGHPNAATPYKWTFQAGGILVYEPNTDNEETVVVVPNPGKGGGLGAYFRKNHAASTPPKNFYVPVVVLGGARVDDDRQVLAVVREPEDAPAGTRLPAEGSRMGAEVSHCRTEARLKPSSAAASRPSLHDALVELALDPPVSAADLEPLDAQGFLKAAKVLHEHKHSAAALAFCRQAALLEPTVAAPYRAALVYAGKLQDLAPIHI